VAGRRDFTSDEWLTMQQAMSAAGVIVSVSEGGTADDMLPEMFAVTQLVMAARRGDPNQLVRELADMPNFQSGWRQGLSRAQKQEYERRSLETIGEAEAIVRAKAPGDLAPFRDFLVKLADAAANANVEGRVFGVGGVRVTPAEAAAIGRIKRALHVP
jgi:hypothetical protein